MLYWIGFVACTSLIVYSGTKLSRYGDIIAEKSGLGRVWIGLILMASVTSLPELVTGVSSVALVGVPDIAVGDVLGSCVFNMLILAMLDAFYRQMPLSTKAHYGHILSAGFGILLLSMVALSIFAKESIPPLGWIGPYSILFVLVYLIAMRLVYTFEKRKIAAFIKEKAVEQRYKDITLKAAIIQYCKNAVGVIVAASFLPKIGVGIAETTGLGQTFVGNIFIALSTSLPEVVVSLSAVRMDAVDLAIGNLFGSNLFDIFILAVDDVFFFDGHLLASASTSHIISTLAAIAMMSVAIIGLVYRTQKRKLLLSWDSIGIMLIFFLNLMLLYMFR
jgi:cation:H+ antiporter